MKKLRKNIILLVLICIVILYFILKDDFNGILDLIINSNKLYILIAILFVIFSDVFKGKSISLLIKRSKFKYKFKDGFLLTLMTNFFNGITPFSLGGQPFELYILKKDNNVDYVSGTNVLFKDFYTYQIAFMFLSTLAIILTYSLKIIIMSKIVEHILWLGFVINLFIMLFLIYIPFVKKDRFKILEWFIKVLSKINIIKDKEKTIEKINAAIKRFKIQTKGVIADFKTILICSILNIFKILTITLSTYFCFKSIGSTVPLFETIVITILVLVMASFVPIPGASGGMEFSFAALFSYFVIDTKLGAALLMWRFITYYLPMIYGSIIFLIKRK